MRIGFVATGGFDRSGRDRIVPALVWLVEHLARRGHDVHVFVLDYYPQPCSYALAGASVHDLGRVLAPPGLRRAAIGLRLAAALKERGPFDVLHGYLGIPAGVLTVRKGRELGVPTVVSLDSGELVGIPDIAYGLQRRWLDRTLIARMLRDATRITVCTEFMANLFSKLRPAAEAFDVTVPRIIPIGVDATRFPHTTRPDGPPWRLVRVGSLNRVKDHETLLRAMRSAVNRLGDVHLDLVGEDTMDGDAQRLAGELNLAGHVTFHGVQPTDRVAALYSSAHLNIVSSRHEAANVTVLEAACSGLMTVGTAVGYVADWAEDKASAVRVADPGALAAAIVSALLSRRTRQARADAARRWALAHDAEWSARQFERLYAQITGR